MKNDLNTPFTDRGVQNTIGYFLGEKNILIDWFECTLKSNINPMFFFTQYLQVPKDEIILDNTGLYSYNFTYSWRDIKIMISNNINLGVHIVMSGKGCRDFESLNLDWIDFFKKLFTDFELNISRIDIAIDTFTDKYFTMQKLRDYIKDNLVVSRFKSSTEFLQKSLSTADIESETIWFGSRMSNIQFVFYNKLMERNNSSYLVDPNITQWYRCESRFRNDVAKNLINTIITNNDYMSIINDILYNYLDFKDYNVCDTNKARWNTSQWWLDFLNTNKKLSLKVNIKESSITRKNNWLFNSVSKSELMVLMSDYSIDDLSYNFIKNLLNDGYSKLTIKDMEMINEYRLSHDKQPITKNDLLELINQITHNL